jgi:hypothetical protein
MIKKLNFIRQRTKDRFTVFLITIVIASLMILGFTFMPIFALIGFILAVIGLIIIPFIIDQDKEREIDNDYWLCYWFYYILRNKDDE